MGTASESELGPGRAARPSAVEPGLRLSILRTEGPAGTARSEGMRIIAGVHSRSWRYRSTARATGSLGPRVRPRPRPTTHRRALFTPLPDATWTCNDDPALPPSPTAPPRSCDGLSAGSGPRSAPWGLAGPARDHRGRPSAADGSLQP